MTIQQLIELIRNKIANLKVARQSAWVAGSLSSVNDLDAEITQTEDTLTRLQTLV